MEIWKKLDELVKFTPGSNVIFKKYTFYTKCYYVSNRGRMKNGDRILSDNSISSSGYINNIIKDDNNSSIGVNRHHAICQIFKPEGIVDGSCVNHIDENRLNNDETNLEWNTPSLNRTHGETRIRHAIACSKRIEMYDLKTGDIIEIYASCMDAERKGGFSNTRVGACCRGIQKKHKGYGFRYATNQEWDISTQYMSLPENKNNNGL